MRAHPAASPEPGLLGLHRMRALAGDHGALWKLLKAFAPAIEATISNYTGRVNQYKYDTLDAADVLHPFEDVTSMQSELFFRFRVHDSKYLKRFKEGFIPSDFIAIDRERSDLLRPFCQHTATNPTPATSWVVEHLSEPTRLFLDHMRAGHAPANKQEAVTRLCEEITDLLIHYALTEVPVFAQYVPDVRGLTLLQEAERTLQKKAPEVIPRLKIHINRLLLEHVFQGVTVSSLERFQRWIGAQIKAMWDGAERRILKEIRRTDRSQTDVDRVDESKHLLHNQDLQKALRLIEDCLTDPILRRIMIERYIHGYRDKEIAHLLNQEGFMQTRWTRDLVLKRRRQAESILAGVHNPPRESHPSNPPPCAVLTIDCLDAGATRAYVLFAYSTDGVVFPYAFTRFKQSADFVSWLKDQPLPQVRMVIADPFAGLQQAMDTLPSNTHLQLSREGIKRTLGRNPGAKAASKFLFSAPSIEEARQHRDRLVDLSGGNLDLAADYSLTVFKMQMDRRHLYRNKKGGIAPAVKNDRLRFSTTPFAESLSQLERDKKTFRGDPDAALEAFFERIRIKTINAQRRPLPYFPAS